MTTTTNPGTIDPVSIQFINQLDGLTVLSVTNWTSYSIDRDFFYPVDSFTIDCADDRADQLLNSIQIGMKVAFSVNNNDMFIGFIDSFDIEPERGSAGKRLIIRGRDRLGMLADSSIYPNLGSSTFQQTYQFKPADTLSHVVNTILQSAPGISGVNIDDDIAGLTAATGFGIGVRQKGKTGRGLAKNYQSNLNHLLKPEKAETYLSYIIRIVARTGCEVKMVPGSDSVINIAPPVYDRISNGQPNFSLVRHTINNTLQNNILSSKMSINYKDQPSVIIAEACHGGATYKRVNKKVICINEITGYDRTTNKQLTLTNARPSVQQAVTELTNGVTSYSTINPNQNLYDAIPNTIADLTTIVSRPKYVVDYNAQTNEELQFYTAQLMAHYQDKYFTLDYEVQGHTQGGFCWAPNLMVNVVDESFHPTKSLNSKFWIKKVTFTRDASGGCRTRLTLTLPYTHLYNVTNG